MNGINLQLIGAFAFGMMLGWNVYFVNRFRKGEIGFGDLTTLVGAVGGAAVLALYKADSDLFGAYGLGLGVGFFLYYFNLVGMVAKSPNFSADWFLDGRRKNPTEDEGYGSETRQTVTPMGYNPPPPANPASPVNNIFYGTNPGDMHSLEQPGAAGNTPPPKQSKG
jgi:hypothetical protein